MHRHYSTSDSRTFVEDLSNATSYDDVTTKTNGNLLCACSVHTPDVKKEYHRFSSHCPQCQRQKNDPHALHRKFRELQRQLAEKDEMIYVLQSQCSLWQKDFEQERRDREQTQSRLIELQKELDFTREQLNQYSEQYLSSAVERRQGAMERIRAEYRSRVGPCSYQASHHGRIVCDGDESLAPNNDIIDTLVAPHVQNDIIDSLVEPYVQNDIIDSLVEPKPQQSFSDDSEPQTADLNCPKCALGFNVENHMEFLEHIDQCC